MAGGLIKLPAGHGRREQVVCGRFLVKRRDPRWRFRQHRALELTPPPIMHIQQLSLLKLHSPSRFQSRLISVLKHYFSVV